MKTPASPESISIEYQIACVKREIALRANVYPGHVANGKMKQEKADAETAAMKAVLESLQDIERLLRIEAAARGLVDESLEYSFDDIGLGCGAPQQQWDDLRDALDPDEPEA